MSSTSSTAPGVPLDMVPLRRPVVYCDHSGRGDAMARTLILSCLIISMIGLILLLAFSPLTTQIPDAYPKLNDVFDRFQIPLINIPFFYKIHLKIYLPFHNDLSFDERNFTMDGRVTIQFRCTQPNHRIVLHSYKLIYEDIKLIDEYGNPIPLLNFATSEEYQILDIETYDVLTSGMNYTLTTTYRGRIDNPRMSGFYSQQYTVNGTHRSVMATHLQTQEARTGFPCLDVPEAKAVFEASIEHPYGTHAVSNTMETETVENGDWTISKFEKTPIMSTYLFAVCVSDFPYSETYTANNIRVRVYIEPSKIDDIGTAIETAPRLLEFYEEYFRIPYPLKKLDIYGVPQLRMGAMENWGLIITQQKFVVYSSDISTLSDKRQVTDLLSHEIAHQWFGNLVTMKWWNNLWLNEGFATVIGMNAADTLENITIRQDEIAMQDNGKALRNDQNLGNSRPCTIPDGVPFNPDTQFNSLNYKKSAAILRMVQAVVGEEVYREGLHNFLSKHAHTNVDHIDLMNAIVEVHSNYSHLPLHKEKFSITEMLNTWILQKGYPRLIVQRIESGDGKNIYEISQKLFTVTSAKTEFDNNQWIIPVFVNDPHAKEVKVNWLLPNQTIHVDMGAEVVVDPFVRMYGRVKYDPLTYQKIVDRLHEDLNNIPTQTRVRLMDDSFSFAEMGEISYGIVLRMVLCLRNEFSYTPVLMTIAHIDFLVSRLNVHPDYPLFREYIVEMFEPHFAKFVNDTNDDLELLQDNFRENVFMKMCIIGKYEPCIDYAKELFANLRESCVEEQLSNHTCNLIPTYLRLPIYTTAIMFGNDSDFEYLYAKYEIEAYHTERDKIFSGLAASKKKEHIYRIFNDVLFVRPKKENFQQRCLKYFHFYHTENHLKSYILENLDVLVDRFKDERSQTMQSIFLCAGRGFYYLDEEDVLIKLETMYKKIAHDPSSADLKLLERVKNLVQFRDNFGPYIFGNLTEIFRERDKIESLLLN